MTSREHLIKLMSHLASLRVYDNSAEADPRGGRAPAPSLLLHMIRGNILHHAPLGEIADWAKSILAAALQRL